MNRTVILNNKSDVLSLKKILNDLSIISNIDDLALYFDDFDGSIETLKNIHTEFFINMIVADLTIKYDKLDTLYLIELFKKSNLNGFVLEKDLLINTLDSSEYTKKRVLKQFYDDFEMQNIIKGFLENDLNTSKASKNMYMHRNTLINKIDKFINVTNYDPKRFKDSFILYNILK